MHSVGLEPAKLILIGTQTTYQATWDTCVRTCRPVINTWQLREYRRLQTALSGNLRAVAVVTGVPDGAYIAGK